MMLEVKVKDRKKENAQKLICLNDIGITRSSLSRIINLKVYINNQFVDHYSADGVIVSTPTAQLHIICRQEVPFLILIPI